MNLLDATATAIVRRFADRVPARAIVLALLGYSWNARVANAGTTTIAEPVIEENITDIDATAVNTIEVDATGTFLHARAQSGHGLWDAGIEAEWRATDRMGVGLEFSATGLASGGSLHGASALRPRGAISWVLLRDQKRQLFLQAEATARYEAGTEPTLIDTTEPALPYTLGLRAASALGPMVLRAALFVEGGRAPVHAPFRTSAAALFTLSSDVLQICFGTEVMLDLARDEPFVLAPEVLVLIRGGGRMPVRIGVSVPTTIGGSSESSSLGLVLRVVLEPSE